MPTQTQTGKAFEYALISEANKLLTASGVTVNVITDAAYQNAFDCYLIFTAQQQQKYIQAAVVAINHIITLEPRLTNTANQNDTLILQLQPDSAGRAGDVRDVLFIRSNQNWEIGISAKNNHRALKHSRLSNVLDFGNSWVGVPCSQAYFNAINPIFTHLSSLKATNALWRSIPHKDSSIYQPLLLAFSTELMRINATNTNIPQKLITYLVGGNDFYKVMKRPRIVEILGFNLHNTLGKKIGGVLGVAPIQRLALPTQIIRLQMRQGSAGTLEMVCDNGWQLSFRIHSAKSLIEPSLKFDINLESNPQNLYSHHIPY